MNLKCAVLAMFTLFLTGEKGSTGPSTCEVKMVPVAAGLNGVILFKTSFKINLSGGSYKEPMEIGWLAASSHGVWDYRREVYLTFDDGMQVTREDSTHISRFESSFQFDEANAELTHLVKKYGINKLLDRHTGRGSVSWTKYGIYQAGKRISTSSVVKSVFGLSSNQGKGNPVKSSFYYEGLALFNNKERDHDDSDSTIVEGAEFFHGSKYKGVEVWALYSIDGLVSVSH